MRAGHMHRRERFILSCGLALGFGVTLVPQIATNNNFWPKYADVQSVASVFQTSFMTILSSGFLVTALTTIFLNLILPYDKVVEEADQVVKSEASVPQEDEVMIRLGSNCISSSVMAFPEGRRGTSIRMRSSLAMVLSRAMISEESYIEK